MTLKGHYALCFKTRVFPYHNENLNKDRPILLATKCSPMILVSGNIRFIRIFSGFPGEGASNDSRVIENGRYVFGTLGNEANIIMWYYLVPRLSTDPKVRVIE